MRTSDPLRPFTVVVADNGHYMDESENYEYGKFETLEAAIVAAKRIVDECLSSSYKAGMPAEALYELYTLFGDDPYVVGSNEPGVTFSARDYARDRCSALCASPSSEGGQHDV